jgi:hypothetical protein
VDFVPCVIKHMFSKRSYIKVRKVFLKSASCFCFLRNDVIVLKRLLVVEARVTFQKSYLDKYCLKSIFFNI